MAIARVNPVDLVLQATGVNASKLAEMVGVNKAAVSVWKRKGEIPLKRLQKVCEISGLPPHLLSSYVPKVARVADAE